MTKCVRVEVKINQSKYLFVVNTYLNLNYNHNNNAKIKILTYD